MPIMSSPSSSSQQDRLRMRDTPRLITTQRSFSRKSSLMRQPSLCSITPPPSATVSSVSSFSFKSFWSTASLKSNSTVKTAVTVPGDFAPLTARLVWGICGKNFKPGILYTRSTRPTSPPSPFSCASEGAKNPALCDGKLVFFPIAKSFKTQCIDEPYQIINRLLEAFQLARQLIPKESKFAACLTEENYEKLVQLKYKAEEWSACGKVDAKYMIPTIAQHVPAAMVDTLIYQPDVWEILGEAARVFSCETLEIPSPSENWRNSSATTAKNASAASASATNSSASRRKQTMLSPNRERERPDWMDLEKHTYRGVLQAHLARIIRTDQLLHMAKSDLEKLTDIFTEVQLSLNMWFAPYSKTDGEVEGAVEFVEAALCSADWQLKGKELQKMVAQAEEVTDDWVRSADELKAWEGDMNVWTLAMGKVLSVKEEMEKVGMVMAQEKVEVLVGVLDSKKDEQVAVVAAEMLMKGVSI